MKTSAITGEVAWAKNFLLNTVPNDSAQGVIGIIEIKVTDNLWIRVDKIYQTSSSRLLKVDSSTGNVLSSFQLTQGSTGIRLKVNKIYFISNDELLVSSYGNKTYNMLGYSQNSQQDAILVKVNATSFSVFTSSACDAQNGNEYSSKIEVDGDVIYQFGIKDDTYLFLKIHNLTTLDLINQKVFLPSDSNLYPGYQSFTTSGIVGNSIVTYYPCYHDSLCLFIFNKVSLSLIKIWTIAYSNKDVSAMKGWIMPYTFSFTKVKSDGTQYIYYCFQYSIASIGRIDITDINNPILMAFGSNNGMSYSTSNLGYYIYKLANIIDANGFLYYIIPINGINYSTLEQLTMFKFTYDLEYLDNCATVPNKMILTILNINYSLEEQEQLYKLLLLRKFLI